MKLTTHELAKPIEEGSIYYTDFNPKTNGYVRQDGIKVSQTYTLSDQISSSSIRASQSYSPCITIKMNAGYTDKNGIIYNNYGTYLMRKYFENTNSFRNTYQFLHDICPGFYFEITNGLGSIANISTAQINMFYKYNNGDTIKTVTTSLMSTEEVLQMTNFNINSSQLQQLAAEPGHTYLKTPAGLFTELTLPINKIITNHAHDSINSAKIELKCMNSSSAGDYKLDIPQNVVMLPSDSLTSFFAKKHIIDNKTSFLASYNPSTNSYQFNNIAGIVNLYAKQKTTNTMSRNWSKVVIVPVELGTSTNSNNTKIITKISHYMGLGSVKLIGNNASNQIKMPIVYSKFNGR